MCPENIRQKFVAAARSVVDLEADPKNPDARRAFLDLIAPGEMPVRQRELATKSTCGLVVTGIWRLAGVVHPILDKPYVTGSAISRLTKIAGGAWISYKPGRLPRPGDTVRVGDNTTTNGAEHVYIVTEVSNSQDVIIKSIDGGQVTKKTFFQCVRAKQRTWRRSRDLCFEGTDPGSNLAGGRIICGWFDAEKMADLLRS
jgi:hypothetical protein